MRVFTYARVSTREQAEEGYSIGAQTEKLRAYCSAMDWNITGEYVDPGYSGGKLERPAIQQLINDVKSGGCDTVLVKKLDRISRSQKDTLFLIEDVFLKNNINFVSIEENFDTNTPMGRAMIGILSVFAQLERDTIKERTQEGLLERAKDGYFHGGTFYPVGYDYVNGHLIINEYEAMQVRLIYDLFVNKGWTVSKIWSHMRENYTTKYSNWKHASSIYSIFTTPIYIGKIQYMGELYEGRHEPLVDEETYYKAQRMLADPRRRVNMRNDSPFEVTNLLGGGLIRCTHCGNTYYAKGVPSGKGSNRIYRPYYGCYSRYKTAKHRITDPNCRNKLYAVCELDYIIVTELRKLAFDNEYLKSKIKSSGNNSDITAFETQLNSLKKQRERLLDLYQLGTIRIEDLGERIQSIDNECDLIKAQIYELEDKERIMPIEEVQELLLNVNEIFENGTFEEKRNIITSLIKYIELDNDDISIYWSFC